MLTRLQAAARALLLCLVATGLTACASVHRQPLRYVAPDTERVGTGTTVLLFPVRESRPQVLLEGRPASWLGDEVSARVLSRQVLTGTGQPLVEIMRDTVAADLRAAGFTVRLSGEEIPTDRSRIAARIAGTGAERALFVDVLELAVRAENEVQVHWNVVAEAYTEDGVVLAEERLEGFTTLEGSFVRPAKAARDRIPDVFFHIVRTLVLEDEEIMSALAY